VLLIGVCKCHTVNQPKRGFRVKKNITMIKGKAVNGHP